LKNYLQCLLGIILDEVFRPYRACGGICYIRRALPLANM